MSCSFVVISPLFSVLPESLFPSDLLESNWMTSHSVFRLRSNIKVTNSSLQPCMYLGYVWPWSRVYFGVADRVVCQWCKESFPPGTQLHYMHNINPSYPGHELCNGCHKYYSEKGTTQRRNSMTPIVFSFTWFWWNNLYNLSSSVRCISFKFWCVWTSFRVAQCHSTPNCSSSAGWWVFHAYGWASSDSEPISIYRKYSICCAHWTCGTCNASYCCFHETNIGINTSTICYSWPTIQIQCHQCCCPSQPL